MSSYFYCRTKVSSRVSKRCLIVLEPTSEVSSAIETYLKQNKKEAYIISEIEPACEGCLNEYLGQRDHMSCPYGCLHDKERCTWCH